MLTIERQEEILEILNRNKSATVDYLASKLFVSGATIRRDLRAMEEQGMIIRSHGGAMPFKSSSVETAFVVREQKDATAKRKIASLAVRLIKNGESIFADSSSTAGYVMGLLQDFTNLTVTTTGIRNATILSSTDMTVKAVSELLQFSDEHYFSYLFKQKIGKSPTEYRK